MPGDKGNYCTLSYRWADDQLRTDRVNLERHKQAIPMQGLHAPVRDAIIVARKLGIPYLWVDALCICQDSEEEKQREMANMHHIYMNSVLTISAIDGALFVRRDGNACRSRRRIRPRVPPDTRGWVLQEQVLSRRVLSYADGELFWNCLQLRASEGSPIATSLTSEYEEWGEEEINSGRRELSRGDNLDQSLRLIWKGLVEAFSVRQLTKPSDRQNAILGLASAYLDRYSAFDKGREVKVVAGILQEDLVRFVEQLCWWVLPAPKDWYCDSESPPKPKVASSFRRPDPLEYLAPTWSWLSVLGPVSYQNIGIPHGGPEAMRENRMMARFGSRFHPKVVLQEITMKDSSSASTISGSILLTGLLTKARIRHSVTGSLFHWTYKNRHGNYLLLALEGRDFPPSGEFSLTSRSDEWPEWYPDIEPPSCDEIFCLYLGSMGFQNTRTAGPWTGKLSYSLCLVQKGGGDVFERIGLCRWKPLEGSGHVQTIKIV